MNKEKLKVLLEQLNSKFENKNASLVTLIDPHAILYKYARDVEIDVFEELLISPVFENYLTGWLEMHIKAFELRDNVLEGELVMKVGMVDRENGSYSLFLDENGGVDDITILLSDLEELFTDKWLDDAISKVNNWNPDDVTKDREVTAVVKEIYMAIFTPGNIKTHLAAL